MIEHFAFSEERAAAIAETDINHANNNASLQSYLAAADLGIAVRKQWIVKTNCSDACSKNAAAGAIELNAAFPSGEVKPPGHANCRCSLKPAIGPST